MQVVFGSLEPLDKSVLWLSLNISGLSIALISKYYDETSKAWKEINLSSILSPQDLQDIKNRLSTLEAHSNTINPTQLQQIKTDVTNTVQQYINSNLKPLIDANKASIASNKAILDARKPMIEGLKNSVDTINNTTIPAINNRITGVNNQATTNKNDIASLKTDNTANKAQINTNKTDIGNLKTDVNNLKTRVTAVEGKTASIQQGISTLTPKVTANENNIRNNTNAINSLRGSSVNLTAMEDMLSYGVRFKTLDKIERVGNPTLAYTLPVHNTLRNCMIAGGSPYASMRGNPYYMGESAYDENFSEGDTCVIWQSFYYKVKVDNTGTLEIRLSLYPISNEYQLFPMGYVGAFFNSISRKYNKNLIYPDKIVKVGSHDSKNCEIYGKVEATPTDNNFSKKDCFITRPDPNLHYEYAYNKNRTISLHEYIVLFWLLPLTDRCNLKLYEFPNDPTKLHTITGLGYAFKNEYIANNSILYSTLSTSLVNALIYTGLLLERKQINPTTWKVDHNLLYRGICKPWSAIPTKINQLVVLQDDKRTLRIYPHAVANSLNYYKDTLASLYIDIPVRKGISYYNKFKVYNLGNKLQFLFIDFTSPCTKNEAICVVKMDDFSTFTDKIVNFFIGGFLPDSIGLAFNMQFLMDDTIIRGERIAGDLDGSAFPYKDAE